MKETILHMYFSLPFLSVSKRNIYHSWAKSIGKDFAKLAFSADSQRPCICKAGVRGSSLRPTKDLRWNKKVWENWFVAYGTRTFPRIARNLGLSNLLYRSLNAQRKYSVLYPWVSDSVLYRIGEFMAPLAFHAWSTLHFFLKPGFH